jgi:ABC-2 type transport system permease protein
MNRGVMDRLLASPVSRGAMMVGTLAYQAITTLIQTMVVLAIAWACGARFEGAALGLPMTLLAAALLSVVFAALSNATALLVRQQEALIGISQFISLPLSFLCAAIMDTRLSPEWVQHVARYNPVDWAVVSSREVLMGSPDWGAVWPRLGALAALSVVMAWVATRAFGSYQRSA